jgi:hypothetical protein
MACMGCVFGELGDGLVGEGASHDPVDVARENLCRVVDRFAASDLNVARREKERMAAHLEHAYFERDARSGRRLLEDHRQRLPFERFAIVVGIRFHVAGDVEDLPDLVRAVVMDLDKIFVPHCGAHCTA